MPHVRSQCRAGSILPYWNYLLWITFRGKNCMNGTDNFGVDVAQSTALKSAETKSSIHSVIVYIIRMFIECEESAGYDR
jgi:hypothetical protein